MILEKFPLWPDSAPGALGTASTDIPTLQPYLPEPDKASGAAIVVCPGGGYAVLAPHEGDAYARWLSANGLAAFVLEYRLGTNGYRHPAMLQDATRAMRTVRAGAAKWNIDPHRIGIMGSSAGGHLSAMLMTHWDCGNPKDVDPIERASNRPDLGVLCYPVTSTDGDTYGNAMEGIQGKNPSRELVDSLAAEKHVTPHTPPCFLWHTMEDATVKVENSIEFARSLRANGVPFDLHVYQKGCHGLGLGDPANPLPWAADCLYWLRVQGFLR